MMPDFSNFLDVQTKTAWGRTLAEFASFCNPSTRSPVPTLSRPGQDGAALARAGQPPGLFALILDVGCGPGLLPALFTQTGCKAYGVDNDFGLLASHLVPSLIQADAFKLPFKHSTFDLVTVTNVLFLLDDPPNALKEWARLLVSDGDLCLLNPSENLSVPAATRLADERGLVGTARQSLLHWAYNAETHVRWTETETRELLAQAGLQLVATVLRVGPGFARFARAKLH